MSADGTAEGRESWPRRGWWLAGIGALTGLVDHLLLRDHPTVERVALAVWVTVTALAVCFIWRRGGWLWELGFALASGAPIAAAMYSQNLVLDRGDGDVWRLFCAVLAIAIAAPLFQAWRATGTGRLRYDSVHDYAWSDVVIWFAAWSFVAVTFGLANLLAALFALIAIDAPARALRAPAVNLPLAGAALGAAIGLLRERDRLVVGLQRIVLTVLAVLAPAMAAGLLLFLASLPSTGLDPLWGATRSTTPIVLSCVFAALVLANAVLGSGRQPMPSSAALRFGAIGLGVAVLPLALIALASVGSRIAQHGFTPDRLWALTFVGVATAYGIAYLAALAWPRRGWARRLRTANLRLAFGLCGLALLLSTPVVDFRALSARDQQARLLSGAVSPDGFDWSTMAKDFGPAGRRALEQLAASAPSETVRAEAAKALTAGRLELAERREARSRARSLAAITVVPEPVQPPSTLLLELRDQNCGDRRQCVLYYTPENPIAVFAEGCESCPIKVSVLRRTGAFWQREHRFFDTATQVGEPPSLTGRDLAAGPVELRAVGPAFE